METDIDKHIATATERAAEFIGAYALTVAGALIVLIIGFILAGVLSRWARRGFERVDTIDTTLSRFLSKIVRYGILTLVIVTVLSQFGVETTSIIAALGAAGLAIGLALQGTLANVASGIMLLVLRPFRVGDYIDAGGISGTVEEIGLFTTELMTFDGIYLMAPNSEIWNKAVINYSRNPTRRFDITIGIGYDDDIMRARSEMLALAKGDGRVLESPEPVSFVSSLDDSSVGIGLRGWTNSADHFTTVWDLQQAAKLRFDEVGISIPYPQREVTQWIKEMPSNMPQSGTQAGEGR